VVNLILLLEVDFVEVDFYTVEVVEEVALVLALVVARLHVDVVIPLKQGAHVLLGPQVELEYNQVVQAIAEVDAEPVVLLEDHFEDVGLQFLLEVLQQVLGRPRVRQLQLFVFVLQLGLVLLGLIKRLVALVYC
jgi:hypothetical protein